jgi:pyruvate-formate lyase-activating enzyme
MDSAAHRIETGMGNELILKNIEEVASAGWNGRLVIRVPIIPGYNDTVENLRAITTFMLKLNLKEINLLPFHRLGDSKYKQLGLEYKYAHLKSPSKEAMLTHQRIFDAAGLRCYIGSETPF